MLRLAALALVGALLCSTFGGVRGSLESELYSEAEGLFEYMRDIRRTLHSQAELMWTEEKTSAYIREKLKELGIPFKHPIAKTGIVGTIGGGSGPKFALRSDIDALPIEEEADVPYKSKTKGKMHACGHDSHMAMLLGAAKLLKARESQLGGTVLLVFQPAEEGGAGAKFMLEEGALEGVQGIHGVHVMPIFPSGVITTRASTLMAGANEFHITIRGRGGHGAMPHLTVDPVVAASAVVNSLQHLVSRVTNPTQGAVISVTRFNTGEGATNVIPDEVKLGGTLRALNIPQFRALEVRATQVVEAVAGAHACNVSISWSEIPYIPVVNDAGVVDIVERVSTRFDKGQATWERLGEPNMTGEDFAFFLGSYTYECCSVSVSEAIPGTFTYLGIYNETVGSVHGLHTAKFKLDETVMPRGAALHAAVALEFLREHSKTQREEL